MSDMRAPVDERDFLRGHHAVLADYDAGGEPCPPRALAVLRATFDDRRIVGSRIALRMMALSALSDHPLMAAWADGELIDDAVLRVAAGAPLTDALGFEPEAFFAEVLRRAGDAGRA